ncbi:MAG: PleD family two-component system response regulator [Rhizobiales bacterium]|nr:PleD family two-component system response regulator [Hyphomicrobiales bacterium]NRB14777.1 PleD family two-component system response regulator [Hyphomicrobiales bacterium]
MSARILVVDDILTNVKLLEAKLTAEYFDVYTATSGQEALDLVASTPPDIILLDVMMPHMDGFEVCRRIKSNPDTQHIPVIMVTALDQTADKLNGLAAGADDFLTKPVNHIALLARVKSLVRLKMVVDELRLRTTNNEAMGVPMDVVLQPPKSLGGNILIVEDDQKMVDLFSNSLNNNENHSLFFTSDPQEGLYLASSENIDLIIISLNMDDFDGLRLCSQLKSMDKTRNLPILVVIDDSNPQKLARALDMGVNDYISHPVDSHELYARCLLSLKRKWYADQLRNNLELSMEMVVRDALTGMFNRRYIDSNLKKIFIDAKNNNKPLSLLLLDIDRFKRVNDNYGHDIGDEILIEFASRIRAGVRGIDIAARLGGEEFVVILPDTDLETAINIAERLRVIICDELFVNLPNCEDLTISMSVGISTLNNRDNKPENLLKRADLALYKAKEGGRNRVDTY